jgi:predicted RNA binding protein YcfA (HicA-like mRNA interferase family)
VPNLSPCSHSELVRKLKRLGYEKGPFGKRGKHPYMTGTRGTIKIPNPHKGDIGLDLLGWILKNASISRDDWLKA